MTIRDEWAREFEKEAKNLLVAVGLSDGFWADIEPKIAVEFTWRGWANAIMTLPIVRENLAMYARDASCWDGIKRRWMPKWVQRRWPSLVEVYDIDEITSPGQGHRRYLLRVEMMTQEEWLCKLKELMEMDEKGGNPGCRSFGTTDDADDWRALEPVMSNE